MFGFLPLLLGEANGQKRSKEGRRRQMVSLVRRGWSLRAVADEFGVTLSHVQRWVQRAHGLRLDRVDWSDRRTGQRHPHNRTPRGVEHLVLAVRGELKDSSDLGDFGADAIREELRTRGVPAVPSVRTVGRILERRGALDGRRRYRWPAPPRGWYLPDVAAGETELDSFDFVEGLVLRGGPQLEVLNGTALHSRLIASWPMTDPTARKVVEALSEHWGEHGLPQYAQFDNDTRFQGPHHHVGAVGRVTRLCLSLGVVPVFVPPREPGFQGAVENLNGRWQTKVWSRFEHESLAALEDRSARFVAASRRKAGANLESAPPRRPFPCHWSLNLHAQLRGRLIYLRRTDDRGRVSFLGSCFEVAPQWPHRLVRCVVDLDQGTLRFHALRRRAPEDQPLLRKVPYVLPTRRFRD